MIVSVHQNMDLRDWYLRPLTCDEYAVHFSAGSCWAVGLHKENDDIIGI
jgi:hypothetical protein